MEKHTVDAPSVEIRTKDADASERGGYFFYFQSVLLPIVLRCSGRDTLIAVWRLSLLLCSYLYSAVCVLSMATRQSKARLLVSLAYAAVLALVVDATLSHVAGTVIIYLGSVWIAGVFGQALAEHNRASSAENSPEKLAGELGLIIFIALVFSACGLIPICINMAAPRGALHLSTTQEDLVGLLPIVLCLCLPVIVCTMKHWLRGGAVHLGLGVECHPGKVLVFCYSSAFIIFTLNFILMIEVAAVVILGLAVFFGYCNAINRCFVVRSKTKIVAPPAVEVKEKQTVAGADGGNKEQTEISPDSTSPHQTDNQVHD